jgi:DNA mismatch endonuclease, patch repair protein
VLTKSQQMSRVRSKNTGVETELRRLLWRAGVRYRLHRKIAECKPDLVIAASKLVVFIDGCFWHGCPVHYSSPRSRAEFWAAKLRTNVTRDIAQMHRLESAGWRVVRFWEHEVLKTPDACADELLALVREEGTSRGDEWRVLEVKPQGSGFEKRCFVHVRDSNKIEWRVMAHVTGAGKGRRGIDPAASVGLD